MKEKDIQTIFSKINDHKGVFELKLCKGKSIRWDSVKPHQTEALKKAKHESLYHKIADQTIGNQNMRGKMKFGASRKKPFDCLNITCPAYVVICFYIPRKQKNFYYIDIDDYLNAWENSEKKSLTEEEAAKLASCKIN